MRLAVHNRDEDGQLLRIISAGIASTNASVDRLSSSLIDALSSQRGWFLLRLKAALLRFFL
jgi:hypothetical protein